VGGAGNGDDVYDAGTRTDTAVYSSATHGITVDLNASDRSGQLASVEGSIGALLASASLDPHTLVGYAQGVDIDTDALIAFETVVGGAGDDMITGNSLEPVSKSFEENNEAGKLDKAEEIVGVVLPANEDPALPLNPG